MCKFESSLFLLSCWLVHDCSLQFSRFTFLMRVCVLLGLILLTTTAGSWVKNGGKDFLSPSTAEGLWREGRLWDLFIVPGGTVTSKADLCEFLALVGTGSCGPFFSLCSCVGNPIVLQVLFSGGALLSLLLFSLTSDSLKLAPCFLPGSLRLVPLIRLALLWKLCLPCALHATVSTSTEQTIMRQEKLAMPPRAAYTPTGGWVLLWAGVDMMGGAGGGEERERGTTVSCWKLEEDRVTWMCRNHCLEELACK